MRQFSGIRRIGTDDGPWATAINARPDNIIFDIVPNPNGGTGISAGGFGHPTCLNTSGSDTLPPVQP